MEVLEPGHIGNGIPFPAVELPGERELFWPLALLLPQLIMLGFKGHAIHQHVSVRRLLLIQPDQPQPQHLL